MSAGANALHVKRSFVSWAWIALAMLLVAVTIAIALVIVKTSAPARPAEKTTVSIESTLDHPRGHAKLAHRDSRDDTPRMRLIEARRGG